MNSCVGALLPVGEGRVLERAIKTRTHSLNGLQAIFTLISDPFDVSRAPPNTMSSYQTFEQAETKTFRPKKHSVMIALRVAAVMVAAFWLGAACVSTTNQGPAIYGLATAPAPANELAAATRAAANETCTKAEFQRDVALDASDTYDGVFGVSNDKQTLAKLRAKSLKDNGPNTNDVSMPRRRSSL